MINENSVYFLSEFVFNTLTVTFTLLFCEYCEPRGARSWKAQWYPRIEVGQPWSYHPKSWCYILEPQKGMVLIQLYSTTSCSQPMVLTLVKRVLKVIWRTDLEEIKSTLFVKRLGKIGNLRDFEFPRSVEACSDCTRRDEGLNSKVPPFFRLPHKPNEREGNIVIPIWNKCIVV